MPVKAIGSTEVCKKKYFLDQKSTALLKITSHIGVYIYENLNHQYLVGFDSVSVATLAFIPTFVIAIIKVLVLYLIVAFTLNIVLRESLTRYELVTLTFRVLVVSNLIRLFL